MCIVQLHPLLLFSEPYCSAISKALQYPKQQPLDHHFEVPKANARHSVQMFVKLLDHTNGRHRRTACSMLIQHPSNLPLTMISLLFVLLPQRLQGQFSAHVKGDHDGIPGMVVDHATEDKEA